MRGGWEVREGASLGREGVEGNGVGQHERKKKPPLSHIGARERGGGGGVDGARRVRIALRVCACVSRGDCMSTQRDTSCVRAEAAGGLLRVLHAACACASRVCACASWTRVLKSSKTCGRIRTRARRRVTRVASSQKPSAKASELVAITYLIKWTR